VMQYLSMAARAEGFGASSARGGRLAAISKAVKAAPAVDRKVIKLDALIIFPGGRTSVKGTATRLLFVQYSRRRTTRSS
jgi:hypothetical protein